MAKIILIRHGQTMKNKVGLPQGHTDSDLTEEGLVQLEKTRDFLKDHQIDVVFSSNLGRAIKTAKKICENRKVEHIIEEDLKELSWGDFASEPTDRLLKKWSDYYALEKSKGIRRENIRPPNGENTFDHMSRVNRFLDKLKRNHRNKNVLIVAHGGTNKVLIGLLRKLDPEEFYTLKQDNACINFLELDEEGKLINMQLNITEHLK
jgi:broad specificity phosphatase PhoE